MNDNIYRVALNGVKSIEKRLYGEIDVFHETLGPLVLEFGFENVCITLLNGDVITIKAQAWNGASLEYRKAKEQQ